MGNEKAILALSLLVKGALARPPLSLEKSEKGWLHLYWKSTLCALARCSRALLLHCRYPLAFGIGDVFCAATSHRLPLLTFFLASCDVVMHLALAFYDEVMR